MITDEKTLKKILSLKFFHLFLFLLLNFNFIFEFFKKSFLNIIFELNKQLKKTKLFLINMNLITQFFNLIFYLLKLS